MTDRLPGSTLDDVRPMSAGPMRHLLRKLALTVLLVVVLLGATGLLGVHSSTVTTRGGGYQLGVTYPRIARAGLDVPW